MSWKSYAGELATIEVMELNFVKNAFVGDIHLDAFVKACNRDQHVGSRSARWTASVTGQEGTASRHDA